MKKIRWLIILSLVLGMFVINLQTVLAFPPIPSGFYGTVKVDGANVPNGTVIYAEIDGQQYASAVVMTYNVDTVYSLDVPGDNSDSPGILEGGVEGDTVVFFIGTIQATQTAIWHSGTNISLNLTGFTNHAPTDISLSNSSVAENAPVNTVVGTLSTTDADAGNTFTYSLVSGSGSTDNGSFNISGSSLRTLVAFDYETKSSYTVRVRTTDQGGLYAEKAFTIAITNMNEAPVLNAIGDKTVIAGKLLHFVASATDVDLPGDTLAFSLIGAPLGASIDSATGEFNWTPTTDQGNTAYSFSVRVTDNGSPVFWDEEEITVTVNILWKIFIPAVYNP